MGDEIKNAGQDTDQIGDKPKGTASVGGKEITQTQKEAKLYPQSEVDAIVAQATSQAGRKIKVELETVTAERDSLKSQLGTVTAEITEIKQTIEDLNKEIEELSKDDPDKIELVKLRKEARAKLATLTAKENTFTERETRVQKSERDQLVYSIASEFVTASGEMTPDDYNRFMEAADKFKLNDQESLTALAVTMGLKPKTEQSSDDNVPEPSAPDSGKNLGGGIDYDKMGPREKIEAGLKSKKK